MIAPCPVAAAARAHPRAPALRFLAATGASESLDWEAQDLEVRRWQSRLRALGLRAGDTLALLAGNQPACVALLHAAARERVLLALLNARLTAAELTPLLARVAPQAVLAARALQPRTPGARCLEEQAALPVEPAREEATWDLAAPHTLLFTSGTEGAPKGVLLASGAHLASARASNALLRFDGASAWLGTLPHFHVGGLSVAVRCALAAAELRLHERFEPRAAAEALAAGATHASLVAATLQATLDARGPLPFPPGVRAVLVGGGPVPAPLLVRAREAGLPVLQTWGLTEAASQVCTERPGEEDGSTAGPPLPGTEVRVVDERGAPLPAGSPGLVEVRGPTLLAGYLDGAPLSLRDGFFATSDLGTLDARGRLCVHARRADLIVSGGENVYPAEVEAVLLAHPAVAEAAVLAAPDARFGEVPVAALALRDAAVADEELLSFCAARLARYKLPRALHRLAALPRLPAGKLDLRGLRALLGLPPR